MKAPYVRALTWLCFSIAVLFLTLGGPAGCQHNLDPAGPYKGDKVLYEADGAIITGHDLLQDFVTWEKDYRPTLAKFPEIRKLADVVVEKGPSWFSTALALRDAYKADPTAANKGALQTGVSVLKAAISEATKYLTDQKSAAPPPAQTALRIAVLKPILESP